MKFQYDKISAKDKWKKCIFGNDNMTDDVVIDKEIMDAFLTPKVVAVVGASKKTGSPGNIITKQMKNAPVKLYVVNPKEDEIEGIRCYKSISEIEDKIDMAVIATPAQFVPPLVDECAKKGVKAIIPIAGGFGEIGEKGKEAEKAMLESIKGKRSRILGPNTLGIWVPKTGLNSVFVRMEADPINTDGGITLISQSGSVGVVALDFASLFGLGLRAFVSLGNEIDLKGYEFIKYFKDDAQTKAIAVYLETISNGPKFLKACRDVVKEKPIVVLKAGRTSRGAKAASSHTGALAGSDNVIDGAFKQYGIIRAFDDEELLDAARILNYQKPLYGNRIAVITSAGGFGVMGTDYIESETKGVGMQLSDLSSETKTKLKSFLYQFASVENPIDFTASVTNEMYDKTFQVLNEDKNVDGILAVVFFHPAMLTDDLVDIVAKWSKEGTKPMSVCSIGGKHTVEILKKFDKMGVAAYPSIWRAARALKVLYLRGKYLKRLSK
jgi:acyl-CoA synthetase (NDP forming)